jgi:hypothetical protein
MCNIRYVSYVRYRIENEVVCRLCAGGWWKKEHA